MGSGSAPGFWGRSEPMRAVGQRSERSAHCGRSWFGDQLGPGQGVRCTLRRRLNLTLAVEGPGARRTGTRTGCAPPSPSHARTAGDERHHGHRDQRAHRAWRPASTPSTSSMPIAGQRGGAREAEQHRRTALRLCASSASSVSNRIPMAPVGPMPAGCWRCHRCGRAIRARAARAPAGGSPIALRPQSPVA